MTPESEPRWVLGEDLWDLVCRVGKPVGAKLLTPLPSRGTGPISGRAAFRVDLEDGRRLKARRHRDLDTASRVLGLRSFVDPRHLPSMVGEDGLCHVTEWVEGDTPDPSDPAVLTSAGAILGNLHGIEVVPEIRRYGFAYEKWVQRNERNIGELLKAGAMGEADAETLRSRLSSHAPESSAWVIIHADLAPENLILDQTRVLVLVDNENLSVDAPGFDLARTWYRWPMNEERLQSFLRGYRTHSDPEPFLAYREFWTLVVLLEAAHFRVTRDTPAARVPLDLLRGMLVHPEAPLFQGRSDE